MPKLIIDLEAPIFASCDWCLREKDVKDVLVPNPKDPQDMEDCRICQDCCENNTSEHWVW